MRLRHHQGVTARYVIVRNVLLFLAYNGNAGDFAKPTGCCQLKAWHMLTLAVGKAQTGYVPELFWTHFGGGKILAFMLGIEAFVIIMLPCSVLLHVTCFHFLFIVSHTNLC
jgi:hypothetical protein